MRTECLVAPGATPVLAVRIRCLHVQHRAVECAVADGSRFVATDRLDIDGTVYVPWDEAVEHVVDIASMPLSSLITATREQQFRLPAGADFETLRQRDGPEVGRVVGRVVRRREAVDGCVRIRAEHVIGRPREDRGRRREHHRLVARSSAARRDRQSLARRGAHDARRRRRRLRVVARPTRGRPCRGGGLRERRHVPRAHRRWRRDALVADHPVRPAGGRSREPR